MQKIVEFYNKGFSTDKTILLIQAEELRMCLRSSVERIQMIEKSLNSIEAQVDRIRYASGDEEERIEIQKLLNMFDPESGEYRHGYNDGTLV